MQIFLFPRLPIYFSTRNFGNPQSSTFNLAARWLVSGVIFIIYIFSILLIMI